jgi:hypothetical protein
MTIISTQLRTFKEPTKDQLTELFFSLPSQHSHHVDETLGDDVEKMEINAVLSLGVVGEEDSYVSNGYRLNFEVGLTKNHEWIGGETIFDSAIPCVFVPRSKVRQIHNHPLDYSSSGET